MYVYPYAESPPTIPKSISVTPLGSVSASKITSGDYSELSLTASDVVDVLDDTITSFGMRIGTISIVTRQAGDDGYPLSSHNYDLYSVDINGDKANCQRTKVMQYYAPRIEGMALDPAAPIPNTPVIITNNIARTPYNGGIIDLVPALSKLNERYNYPFILSGANANNHRYGETFRGDIFVNDYNELVSETYLSTDTATGYEYIEFEFLDGWRYKFRVYGVAGGMLRYNKTPVAMYKYKPGLLKLDGGLKKDPLYPPTIENPLVLTGILLENPKGNKDAIDSLKEQFPYLVLGL